MKTFRCILFIFLIGLFWADDVNAFSKPKRKANTSCTITRGKFTVSDQIEYRYGIVGGQNITFINSEKGTSQDVITGWMGGVAFQAIWPKGFAVQPEVLYSQKGCILSSGIVKYNIDYIEVPVKVMYRLHMAEAKPFAFAAPYGAYAIRIAQEGVTGGNVFSDEINKFDFGIGVGAGFDVWKIQLSFKYSWGFAQVANETFTIRNKVFTISAGLFF